MKTTKRCKNIPLIVSLVDMLAVLAPSSATPGTGPAGVAEASGLSAAPVAYWSNEARRAIVPAGRGGVFGP